MIPRRSFCLALAPVCASAFMEQEGHPVPETPCTPEAFIKSIESVMGVIDAIRPGMTRGDLFKVFTEEGGLSWRTRQTYVYKLCPYIKVDFDFEPATDKIEDKIVRLSRPYLQYSMSD